MATLTTQTRTARFTPQGTVPGTVRGMARAGWTALAAMVRARQTRRLLAEMDDRLLADIGIGRGDALMEAARPAWDTASRSR